jgi:hypothetical protein
MYGIIILLFICVAAAVIPFVAPRARHQHMSVSEVADLLERFANDQASGYDWDDFLSVQLDDPNLDAVRLEAGRLAQAYPPPNGRGYCSDEGKDILRALAAGLRARS